METSNLDTLAVIGRQRVSNDGARRYTPVAITFDTRAHLLTSEINEAWEPEIQQQWQENRRRIRESLMFEYGVRDHDQKIDNFASLGSAPWSVGALHNTYMTEIRSAFASGHYYPSLLGACGLGERILNQLVLTLRDDYKDHSATRFVKGKRSLDDWGKCITTLQKWGVFTAKVSDKYRRLMTLRHAAVHYRPDLDSGDARMSALAAILELQDLVNEIFSPHASAEWYFTGPIGRSFIRRDSEDLPFVRRFLIPACVLVSPVFRLEHNPDAPGGFDAYDDPTFGHGQPDMTDAEFATPIPARLSDLH